MSRQGVLIGAIALLGLVPTCLWLWTAWQQWPAQLVQRAISRGEPVDTATLQRVWADVQGVEEGLLPGRHLHLPGMIGQLLLERADLPAAQRREILLTAEQASRRALARDPADARAWARLAWFIELRRGPAAEMLAALQMSHYLAPTDPALLAWRDRAAARNGAEIPLTRHVPPEPVDSQYHPAGRNRQPGPAGIMNMLRQGAQ